MRRISKICVANPLSQIHRRQLSSSFICRNSSPSDPSSPSKLRIMAAPKPVIQLTAEEAQVRSLIVDCAKDIDKARLSQSSGSDTIESLVLRITGGWVRDKLLKGKSNDIDIGINLMTGFDFASHLSKYLKDNLSKYNIPARSIHKIESNPEKSKHLETATTKIMGLDIDFVNLRSETYSEESRIPQMVQNPAELCAFGCKTFIQSFNRPWKAISHITNYHEYTDYGLICRNLAHREKTPYVAMQPSTHYSTTSKKSKWKISQKWAYKTCETD